MFLFHFDLVTARHLQISPANYAEECMMMILSIAGLRGESSRDNFVRIKASGVLTLRGKKNSAISIASASDDE
jgi:hypothetical protein